MHLINVAVVGVGYWGPNLVRNFLKVPGIKVNLVCDTDKKKLSAFSSEYPFIKTTQDFRNVLRNKSLHVVAIATPITTHYKLAKSALESGKHVLIEKPFTSKVSEAEELVKIAKSKKRVLMVGHTFIYTSAVRKIKELMSKEELGDIHYYHSTRINLGLIQSDANVIWDLAPHDLSILNYILREKPVSVNAFGASYVSKKHYEIANIFLQYTNNITAHIHVSWLSPVKIRQILIGGSKKMVEYNDIEPSEKIRIYDRSVFISPNSITPFSPAYRSGDVIIPHLDQTEALEKELGHFIDCVRHKKVPVTDGKASLNIVQMLEAIDESVETSRSVYL